MGAVCVITLALLFVRQFGEQQGARSDATLNGEPAPTGITRSNDQQPRGPESAGRAHNIGSQRPANDRDLFATIESLTLTAYEGNSEAQFTIAAAIAICDQVAQFRNVQPKGFEGTIDAQASRCRKLATENPYSALPAGPSYDFQYWLARAAENRHPVALAWQAATDIYASGSQNYRSPALREIEDKLRDAARGSDPRAYFYIGSTLSGADKLSDPALRASVRGTAWFLLSCRLSDMCVQSPEALISDTCRLSTGSSCDPQAAFLATFEGLLGSAGFAEAYAMSLEIEDAVTDKRWDDLPLALR